MLELIVTEYLYGKYQHQNEGDLTAYRSALVNAITLGDLAAAVKIMDLSMRRGAITGAEATAFGVTFDKISSFVSFLEAQQAKAAAQAPANIV